MTKNKERSEVEHLRGVVKSQRATIKQLQKEVTRLTKREHLHEDLELKLAEQLVEEEVEETKVMLKREKCPECGDEIEVTPLGAKKLFTCTSCKYRKLK